MSGIISYGAYIPLYRLSRNEIARAWGAGGQGERAVANFDEDSLTMAVEAAFNCLKGVDRNTVGGVYFASTTSPYREKQTAATIATALDLPRNIATMDFTDSLRSGGNAFRAALDAVKAGSARKILVAIADCRLGIPRSEFELNFGDGAAAFLIGDDNVAASIEHQYTHYDEITDLWRTKNDEFVKSWEDRFINLHGYQDNVKEAATAMMKKSGLKPGDVNKLVLYAPDARSHLSVAKELGFDYKTQVQDSLFSSIGNTGTAYCWMMLVAALEHSKPGERLLLVDYGDGSDAYVVRVTDGIEGLRNRRGIDTYLKSKKPLLNYEKYVSFRQLMSKEAARRPADFSSPVIMWRDRDQVLRLHGSRCRNCGVPQYPIQRICAVCFSKDNYEEVSFREKKATIYTFTVDNLAMVGDPPMVKAVVDYEGGGRMFLQMTDRDPSEAKIGLPIELCLRIVHEAAGFYNYYWKCRPLRGER